MHGSEWEGMEATPFSTPNCIDVTIAFEASEPFPDQCSNLCSAKEGEIPPGQPSRQQGQTQQ